MILHAAGDKMQVGNGADKLLPQGTTGGGVDRVHIAVEIRRVHHGRCALIRLYQQYRAGSEIAATVRRGEGPVFTARQPVERDCRTSGR